MYKAAFVILHYETLEDTIECIESILKNISYNACETVVVDNGSSNKSGERIKSKFSHNAHIHVLINDKNLGFARGNNIGYEYARNILKADFIIIINSDTIIRQSDFIEKIINRYNSRNYDILGPDIISLKDGSHQNPRIEVLVNEGIVKKYIKYFRYTLFLNYLFIDQLVIKIKKIFSPGSKLPGTLKGDLNPGNRELEDVKLHGSALVFSPDFIKNHHYSFYPETFLYCEESILFFFARKEKLKTVYFPDAQIYHKEDVTSDYLIKSDLMKRRFYLKHNIRSAGVLLKLYNNQEI